MSKIDEIIEQIAALRLTDGWLDRDGYQTIGMKASDLKLLRAELLRTREALAAAEERNRIAEVGLNYAFPALQLVNGLADRFSDEDKRHIDTAYQQVRRTLRELLDHAVKAQAEIKRLKGEQRMKHCSTCICVDPIKTISLSHYLVSLNYLARHPNQPMWCGAWGRRPADLVDMYNKGYIEPRVGQFVGKDPKPRVGVVITSLGLQVLKQNRQLLIDSGFTPAV